MKPLAVKQEELPPPPPTPIDPKKVEIAVINGNICTKTTQDWLNLRANLFELKRYIKDLQDYAAQLK